MESSNLGAASEDLANMAESETSLLALVRTLLNTRTLPHVLLMLGASVLLFLLSKGGMDGFAALGFISIALGYVVTGLLSSFGAVQRWTTLPGDKTVAAKGPTRFIHPFRICLFPLGVAVLWAVILLSLFGENGALGDRLDSLPLVLSGLFVLWAVVQARSLSSWLSAVSAKRLPESTAREGGLLVQIIVHSIVLLALMTVLLSVFTLMGGGELTPSDLLMDNVVFLVAVVGLGAVSIGLTRHDRQLAAGSSHLHRFSGRWLLFTQFFVLWHALTVWRHQAMAPPSALLVAEELMLMMFTVLMAIWGLTSKSVKSSFRIVHDGNALPMGLAFGYAYAGSVAMLTVVLDDIKTVMMAGHIVVLCSLLWIQRSVLKRVIGRHDDEVRINRAVAAVAPSVPVALLDEQNTTVAQEPAEAVPNVVSQANVLAEASMSVPDPVDVDWVDDDVEVLADEVDWSETDEQN